MGNKEEFSTTLFAAGTITGIRSFKIDEYNRLTGVSYQEVWKPGVNEATCKANNETAVSAWIGYSVVKSPVKGDESQEMIEIKDAQQRTVFYGSNPPSYVLNAVTAIQQATQTSDDDPDANKHRVGNVDCTCGFYAYFDTNDNPYHKSGEQVMGIVEAHGTVSVGSRGFRAQKAQLQALIIPSAVRFNRAQLIRNYGVPLFETAWDAIQTFPLTSPDPAPSPDTDPDFWTR